MSNAPSSIVQFIGFTSIATPPTPPGGVVYTFLDSTGTLKQINDQGVVSAFGGGGGGLPVGTGLVYDTAGVGSIATPSQAAAVIGDPWAALQVGRLKAANANLTGFRSIPFSTAMFASSSLAAVTGDALIPGGGVFVPASSIRPYGVTMYQLAKTTAFGFAVRQKFAALPTTGKFSETGLANAAGTHLMWYGFDFATSTTNFMLEIGATTVVSSLAADTNWHDVMLVNNPAATTVSLFIDGVSVASTSTLTNLFDEPLFFYQYNTTAGENLISDGVFGYIRP